MAWLLELLDFSSRETTSMPFKFSNLLKQHY